MATLEKPFGLATSYDYCIVMIEDTELLRRYVEERDEGAFRVLVARHLQFVYGAARRRLNGDQHAAEDVAQLVFTAAAKQARTLHRGVLFPAWLYRTTRNVSVDFIRAQSQRRRREQEAIAMHEPSICISPEKLRPLLDAAIDELNQKDREAIVLRFFSQLTLAQVGAAFRVSEDAARMRVDRALRKLQSALTRRGITSTAVALGTALANEALLAAPEGVAGRICGSAISAASAIAPAASVTIGFMSSIKSFTTGVSLLVGLSVVSFEMFHWRMVVAERVDAQRVAADTAERARTIEADAQKAAQALSAAQLQLAMLRDEQTRRAQQADSVAARAAQGPAAKPWDEIAEGTAFMKRHPEVKDALSDYARARARFSYGPFLDSLTLTPTQREKLEVHLMRGQGMGAPVPGAISDERQLTLSLIGPDGGEWGRSGQWAKETLGPEGMRRLDDYRKKMFAREEAVRIAGALWNSESPVTPAQAEQLATVFADHRSTVNWQSVYDWDRITAAAATFLSSFQLTAIEARRTQEQFNAILSRPAAAAPADTANLTTHP